MCKKTHTLKCAAAPTLLALVLACGTLAAPAARPAAADVVRFDNSDGTFVWWPGYGPPNPEQPPASFLDPTQSPAGQDAADPARSLRYWINYPIASDELATDSISCGINTRIAVVAEPVIFYYYGVWEVYPPRTFSHSTVGPGGNWWGGAETGYDTTQGGSDHTWLGSPRTIGIRLSMPDGVHYGFVTLAAVNLVWYPIYQPIAWGYETEPDTPIMICDVDYNTDGVVNSQDFFDFLSLFFVSDPRADFNHWGGVTSSDFFAFLDAFFVGCS